MKPYYFQRSVAFRLSIWSAVVVLVLVALHLIIVQSEERLSRTRAEGGEWIAKVIRSLLASRSTESHQDELRVHLAALRRQSDVLSVQIFTPSGHLFASGLGDTTESGFEDVFQSTIPCGSCHKPDESAASPSPIFARARKYGRILAMNVPIAPGPDCLPCHEISEEPLAHLHLGLSMKRIDHARVHARRRLLASGVLILLLTLGGIAVAIDRLVGRPLRGAVRTMERFQSGDRTARLPAERDDDIGYLSSAFNKVAHRVQEAEESLRTVIDRQNEEIRKGREQIIHQERMAAVGLLSAGVAHEIGNPLTAISSIVQLMHHRTSDPTIKSQTSLILAQIDRISRIVKEMGDLSRPPSGETKPSNLNEIARAALELVRFDKRTQDFEIEVDLDSNLPEAAVVPDQILQVLLNLMQNAVDAMPAAGKLSLRTGHHDGAIWIEVEDTGEGMAEETIPRIFEPFFTTKEPGRGTGLGLSVSYGIVKSMGGRIEVTSRLGEGSRFRVCLPGTSEPRQSTGPPPDGEVDRERG